VDTTNAPGLPSLFGRAEEEDHSLGLGIDDSDHDEPGPVSMIGPRAHQPFQQQQEAYDSPDEDENDDDMMEELADRLAGFADAPESPRTNRLYAGPRYATATFRLIYSTAAVTLALYYFSQANFWPWYVGGTGSTANCWDLSGGLALGGLDADFDRHNHVLKRYFIWQASYHWHSGAFHILSMVLLLLHPSEGTQKPHERVWALRTNTSVYYRSLAQHVLGLGAIATAYVFSSLRRLTAIGLFAFDVSSWFLHLLQLCINAPPDSRLARIPAFTLHRYAVVPVFVMARLGIWPALAYSAMFDSGRWLDQLERTLWPGSAQQLRALLCLEFVLLLSSTAVYGKRLWLHDHVRRVGAKMKEE
jgi:hypothetical protein